MKILSVLFIALLLALSGCGESTQTVGQNLGIDLQGAQVVKDEDTHGGFHGDGDHQLVMTFAEDISGQLAENDQWKPLPLTENLQTIADGYAMLPEGVEVSEGYYYFRDRHSQSTDSTDDSQLLDRYSYNFDLAIYDSQTQTLYHNATDT